jgi:hypothetical protein
MDSIAGDPTTDRLSAVAATLPGEPLFENLPEADPRHNALAPFFETSEGISENLRYLLLTAQRMAATKADHRASNGLF